MDDAFLDLLVDIGLDRAWARAVVQLVEIAVVLTVAFVAGRLVTRAAQRSIRTLALRSPLAESARAQQRAQTLSGVVASTIRVAVWTVASLLVLDELGINVGPLLAGASIVGVAIAFGAQSLVKDIVSGFFILMEDQYGVGDVVHLEGASGTVEEVNLRITRLRAADGTVWFVPNGEIRKVGNGCKGWSRALVDIVVPADEDVASTVGTIAEEAAGLASDPAWHELVLEEPEVLGVESLSADGVTVRVAVKTAPQAQDRLARELRSRVSSRLRHDGLSRRRQPAQAE